MYILDFYFTHDSRTTLQFIFQIYTHLYRSFAFYSVGTTAAMKPEILAFDCGLLLQIPLQLAWFFLVWPLPGPKEMDLFVGLLRTIENKEYIE